MQIKALLLNYVALFFLLALTADALVADWQLTPWTILYARIHLNLFYNAHAASILSVCVAGYYLAFVKKDGLALGVFAAFSTASIHEITLDATDLMVFHQSSGLSPTYLVYLLGFLLAGLKLARPYHRRIMFVTALMMLCWFLVLTSLPHYSTIDPNVPFGPSADFNNVIANFEEVSSWLAPVSLWFLPRRWFIRG